MAQEQLPASVPGMVRALEDFLEATRPPEPPAPPRAKTSAEAQLEQLLEDLSRPRLPDPPKPAEPPAEEPVAPITIEEIAAEIGDDFPTLPQPEPEPATTPAPKPAEKQQDAPAPAVWPRRRLLLALLFPAVAIVGQRLIRRRHFSTPPKPVIQRVEALAAPVAPLPADPQARALALALAYRPGNGPISAGEIFRSIVGDPIPAENWELKPGGPDRFLARFVPYRQTMGDGYSYEFEIDERAGRVKPTPETEQRLRVDALGRLAGRSNVQAFWQMLDLSR